MTAKSQGVAFENLKQRQRKQQESNVTTVEALETVVLKIARK
jgi:hypothetical protein